MTNEEKIRTLQGVISALMFRHVEFGEELQDLERTLDEMLREQVIDGEDQG